eukprot:SAG22_NODE_33_length_27588_cov_104.174652_12_plen_208_part_00
MPRRRCPHYMCIVALQGGAPCVTRTGCLCGPIRLIRRRVAARPRRGQVSADQPPDWVHDVDPKREAARETPRDPSLVAKHVLKARPDVMAERSELELLLADRGHILVMSPKCHPELAGQGVEYSWGASKLYYRRRAAHFHDNVLKALAQVDRRFERRAREYRRALKDPENHCFDKIESCRRTFKTHRNAVDFDAKFIRTAFLGGELS